MSISSHETTTYKGHGKNATADLEDLRPPRSFSGSRVYCPMVQISNGGYVRFLKLCPSLTAYQSAELHERQGSVEALLCKEERLLTANRGCSALVFHGFAHGFTATCST